MHYNGEVKYATFELNVSDPEMSQKLELELASYIVSLTSQYIQHKHPNAVVSIKTK